MFLNDLAAFTSGFFNWILTAGIVDLKYYAKYHIFRGCLYLYKTFIEDNEAVHSLEQRCVPLLSVRTF